MAPWRGSRSRRSPPTTSRRSGCRRRRPGDVATLIRFAPTVTLTRSLQGLPDKTAVKTLTTLTAPDGRVYAVLGVAGEGCFAVQVPMWDDPSTQDTPFVDVTVDIQH